MSKEERNQILISTREIGLYIDTICLSGQRKYPLGSMIAENEKTGMLIMEKAIQLAYDLGVRIIQIPAYDVYYNETSTPESKEKFTGNLYKSATIASKYGVIIALETMENDFCNTIEKAMHYVREINSPYLKVYPDIGNITNSKADIITDIQCGNGNIVAAHLKETVPGVFRNLLPGDGAVDFKTAIELFTKCKVSKFNAEIWFDGKSDWEEKLVYVNRFFRTIFRNTLEEK